MSPGSTTRAGGGLRSIRWRPASNSRKNILLGGQIDADLAFLGIQLRDALFG